MSLKFGVTIFVVTIKLLKSAFTFLIDVAYLDRVSSSGEGCYAAR